MPNDVAPFEWLEVVVESAYGVPKTSPVAGTDSLYIRLSGPNRFTMRTKPKKRKIVGGGGYAVPAFAVSDQFETMGDLSLELSYTQASVLCDWAITRINSGQTTPWTTTEPPGDLASCTIYHGTMRDDGTVRKRQYNGVKVTNWNLPITAETGTGLLKLGLRAKKAGPDPTSLAVAPADTAFPTDLVLFYQASGAILKATVALTLVEGVTMSATNGLDARYYLSQYLTLDRLKGRAAKAELDVQYTSSPEWRTLYEALTSEALSFAWTNTTHTIAFDYNTNNLVDDVGDDLTPGKVYNQKVTYENQWDTSVGGSTGDVTFTFT